MPPLHNKRVGSHYGHMGPRWLMKNLFRRIDSFAKEVPSFNIGGQTNIGSTCGGVMSFAVIVIAFMYATLQMI